MEAEMSIVVAILICVAVRVLFSIFAPAKNFGE